MYALALLIYLWLFWYVYILVMGLYRAHLGGRLNKLTYALAAPALVVGYAMDVVANLTVASALFLEWPRELLVTSRLQRHNRGGSGWRKHLADWICTHLLDYFDHTGNHC